MTRYTGGTKVGGGYYGNPGSWEVEVIPAEGGALVAAAGLSEAGSGLMAAGRGARRRSPRCARRRRTTRSGRSRSAPVRAQAGDGHLRPRLQCPSYFRIFVISKFPLFISLLDDEVVTI